MSHTSPIDPSSEIKLESNSRGTENNLKPSFIRLNLALSRIQISEWEDQTTPVPDAGCRQKQQLEYLLKKLLARARAREYSSEHRGDASQGRGSIRQGARTHALNLGTNSGHGEYCMRSTPRTHVIRERPRRKKIEANSERVPYASSLIFPFAKDVGQRARALQPSLE